MIDASDINDNIITLIALKIYKYKKCRLVENNPAFKRVRMIDFFVEMQ